MLPYFNKETFISVMEGGKALRHQVFMYMDCKCQHVCGPCVILLLCFRSLVRLLLLSFPPGSKQNTLNCLSVSLFQVVMLYLILCSSHVAGMIGLINKTKGLRFCNVSGFLELYNDPQVRLTAINSQSFHSKHPWLLIDYCWFIIICLAIVKKKLTTEGKPWDFYWQAAEKTD